MRRQPPRGQTLALFALTMLLLTLMVTLTLSMGMRVREKIELQNVADAAAYSNAVATARTFNTMAVLNRTQWALLVAQTTTQAIDDYVIEYAGTLSYLNTQAQTAGCSATFQNALSTAWTNVLNKWTGGLDDAAVGQVHQYNIIQAEIQGTPPDGQTGNYLTNYNVLLNNILQGQQLTQQILNQAKANDPWPGSLSAPAAADAVSLREANYNCTNGAACNEMIPDAAGGGPGAGQSSEEQYEIYMGTRGDHFTTGRIGPTGADIQARLMANVAGLNLTFTTQGSSYRSDEALSIIHDQLGDPAAAVSDGDGVIVNASGPGCTNFVQNQELGSHTGANLSNVSGDNHIAGPATPGTLIAATAGSFPCPNEGDATHTLIGDIAGGNWPIVLDYNQAVGPGGVPLP